MDENNVFDAAEVAGMMEAQEGNEYLPARELPSFFPTSNTVFSVGQSLVSTRFTTESHATSRNQPPQTSSSSRNVRSGVPGSRLLEVEYLLDSQPEISKPLRLGWLPQKIISRKDPVYGYKHCLNSQEVYVIRGTSQQLLLVAYSPNSIRQATAASLDVLLMKARILNAKERQAILIVGEEDGDTYYFLQMTLFPIPTEEIYTELVSIASQVLERMYHADAAIFDDHSRMLTNMILVEEFLKSMQFVIAKKQQEGEEEDVQCWKFMTHVDEHPMDFYLEITVTAVITFQIYWTFNNHLPRAVPKNVSNFQTLVYAINSDAEVGDPKYVLTKQGYVVLSLDIDSEDCGTETLLKNLDLGYEKISDCYRETSSELLKLQESALFRDLFSEERLEEYLIEYIPLANSNIQVLDYSDNTDLFRTDIEALHILKSDPSLQKYTLPIDYTVYQTPKKITINFDSSLIPVSKCFESFPEALEQVLASIQDLQNVLLPLKTFPRPNMLFCRPDSFALLFLPGQGLHHDSDRFLFEVFSLVGNTG